MLLALIVLVAAGCVSTRLGVSWPSISMIDDQYILLAYNSYLVLIEPATGEEVKLRDSDGNVRIDPETGEARTWELDGASNQQAFYSTPLRLDDNTLLAAEYNGRFVKIDYAAARINNPAGNPISGHVVADVTVGGDRLYVGYNSQNLEAFDLESLSVLWAFETTSGIWSKPLLHNGVLYITSMDHNLYAIDSADGSELWRVDLQGAAAGAPVIANDRLYVGTFARTVVEVNLEGEITATFTANNWVWGSPVIEGDIAYVTDLSGYVYALSVPGLEQVWSVQAAESGIRPSVLLAGDFVVTASRDGRVTWLDKGDGSVAIAREPGTEVLSEMLYIPAGPNVSQDIIVVATVQADRPLVAFGARDGQLLWEYRR
ncbi:MAG: PQQ-binding-like beta-propeller repeat protein [Chloroflexi bacterium]|nr:PQQ-binding-like beta-propeller repeat protein [Chloroflexota bacterium]